MKFQIELIKMKLKYNNKNSTFFKKSAIFFVLAKNSQKQFKRKNLFIQSSINITFGKDLNRPAPHSLSYLCFLIFGKSHIYTAITLCK